MNTITILALIALIVTGLACIHETRLRRAAHNAIRRLISSTRHENREQGRARDGG